MKEGYAMVLCAPDSGGVGHLPKSAFWLGDLAASANGGDTPIHGGAAPQIRRSGHRPFPGLHIECTAGYQSHSYRSLLLHRSQVCQEDVEDAPSAAAVPHQRQRAFARAVSELQTLCLRTHIRRLHRSFSL
jgi:hypothetical protein